MVKINKKGMDISLNFIILAVLALIALIVIALFFTGGLTNLFKQQEEVGSISSEKVALYTSKCNYYCTTHDDTSWKNAGSTFPEEIKTYLSTKSGGDGTDCGKLTDKNYETQCKETTL